ncbi:UNVERIFIED_CONTAM: hypothetical protein FKN15_044697 [Acipenser sinensis]
MSCSETPGATTGGAGVCSGAAAESGAETASQCGDRTAKPELVPGGGAKDPGATGGPPNDNKAYLSIPKYYALDRRFGKVEPVVGLRQHLATRKRVSAEKLGVIAANVLYLAHRGYPDYPLATQGDLAMEAFIRGLTSTDLRQSQTPTRLRLRRVSMTELLGRTAGGCPEAVWDPDTDLEWEEPWHPTLKWEEPKCPTPKWKEPEHPAPRRREPERPAPRRRKPERLAPRRRKPERPAPRRRKPERPAPRRRKPVRPVPRKGEPSIQHPEGGRPSIQSPKGDRLSIQS